MLAKPLPLFLAARQHSMPRNTLETPPKARAEKPAQRIFDHALSSVLRA
jgi:hypothetical protein